MQAEGGCHCGAVRYVISGPPLASTICHCRTCQRISGEPVMAWISVNSEQFCCAKGKPAQYASSPGVSRGLCSACGTQLTYSTAVEPDGLDIATATLDAPSAFPASHHFWLSHNIAWVKFGDGLPQHQRARGG